jgi:phosphoribosylformylglycinamidine synthase
MNLEEEIAVQETCLKGIRIGLVRSAHDCSEGGLAVALAESCFSDPGKEIGARISLPDMALRTDAFLFGESQSRIILSMEGGHLCEMDQIAQEKGVPLQVIGQVKGKRLSIDITGRGVCIDIEIGSLKNVWQKCIAKSQESR